MSFFKLTPSAIYRLSLSSNHSIYKVNADIGVPAILVLLEGEVYVEVKLESEEDHMIRCF